MIPIRLHEIRKSFVLGQRRIEALRGVDLTIDAPGFHAIMGRSGSGKSTLLHVMAALDSPDSGTAEVAGQPVHRMNERELTRFRRRTIGIVFQQFNLVPTLTALENAALPGVLDGRPAKAAQSRAGELLERLGLSARLHHRPDALSGGEQQRVAIARALHFDPPVVFADEPTGSLDSRSSGELWSLLRALSAERRTTLVIVTHEATAAAHCERVHLLRDGVIADTFEVRGMHASDLAARAEHAAG